MDSPAVRPEDSPVVHPEASAAVSHREDSVELLQVDSVVHLQVDSEDQDSVEVIVAADQQSFKNISTSMFPHQSQRKSVHKDQFQ